MKDKLDQLQQETLPPDERLIMLQSVYHDLIIKLNYTPPSSPTPKPSFLNRFPRLKLALSLLLAGFIVFCDVFVNVSTILGELLSLGSVIFALSLAPALILTVLVILLQLSLLARLLDFPLLKPPQHIQSMMNEREELKQIAALMETKYFDRACREGAITKEEYQALINIITERSRWLEEEAEKLEEIRQSKRLTLYRATAIFFFSISSLCAGVSSGYFFMGAITLCFPFIVPLWLPLVMGLLAGIAVLAIFWDTQKQDVSHMVNWACGCDKPWIEAMTQRIILPKLDMALAPVADHSTTMLSDEEQRLYQQLEQASHRSSRAMQALRAFHKDEPHDREDDTPQRLSTLPISA